MASKEAEKTGDESAPLPAAPISWHRQLLSMKDTIIIVITPFIFLPIMIMYSSPAAKCAYCVLIIAVYWCTECLPMAVTSILPIVLMTWLGVMDSRELSRSYLKDANFLFLGGLMFAIAVERWGLHKRVALRVLLLVGSRPVWILFGNMAVIGFLSMWLANIATCAMMIPIAAAVLDELNAHRLQQREEERQKRLGMEMKPLNGDQKAAEGEPAGETAGSSDATVVVLDGKRKSREEAVPLKEMDETMWAEIYAKEDNEFRLFACALKISVSYAASIGGTGTLIGSGPNIVLKGQAESIYGADTGINFFSFFLFAFPNMVIILLVCWLSLVLMFIGPRKAFGKTQEGDQSAHSAAHVLRREYEKLGPISWAELWVMGLFLCLALMWITKQPQFVTGWGDLMAHNYVTDSVVAVTVCMFLFVVPSRKPNYFCLWNRSDPNPPGPAPSLLDWKTVHRDMQWGVILLLGGGFAIADACRHSKLSDEIASFLQQFASLQSPVIVLLVTIMSVFCTAFTSNVATATLLIPIAAQMANGIEVHPVYLIFPVAIAVNFSFILPVSTPGNAIVFAYGDITVPDMMKVGIVNTIIDIAVLQLAINTWGAAVFDFTVFPGWARNATLASAANATCP